MLKSKIGSLKANDVRRLTFVTPGADPTWCTLAMSIAGLTLASVKTPTLLGTIDPVGVFGTRSLAVLALPSRPTLTVSSNVVALGSVFAVAATRTVLTVTVRRAWVLAGQTHVTRTTNVLTRDVVTSYVF